MKKALSTILVALPLLFAFAVPAFAQTDSCEGNTTSLMCMLAKQPGLSCITSGSCGSLDSILQVFAVVAQWLLGLAGSVMVLMFVWGGAEWTFSRGEADMVKGGKAKMTNAVIGIVLMFGALAVVRSIRVGLVGEDSTIVACVVDSDCNSGAQCGGTGQPACARACFGGQCVSRAAADAASQQLGCATDDNCNAGGTQPWKVCLAQSVTGAKQCGYRCQKEGGACQGNPTGTSGGNTNPCGTGVLIGGATSGQDKCGDPTAVCCGEAP